VGFIERALSLEEEIEVADLLSESGPRTLLFARGVFAAAATSPNTIDPTDWLPLILGDQIPSSSLLKRILALLMRDYNHVATQLAEGKTPAPESVDEDVVREYCRGYVQIAQKDKSWTSSPAAFDLTVPLMVLSGYIDSESLRTVSPEAAADPVRYRETCRVKLGDSVRKLYDFFKKAREESQKSTTIIHDGKVGRNDPCPCGSGKKFKKCCGMKGA
jgi:uncharacterized protein